MNSDLVYKKKYLKYKSKYIALQRQLNVQEGGWPSFTTLSTKSKLGIYLFLVNDPVKYKNLLDGWELLKELYFKDSGSEISKMLGEGCYYIERKTNIIKSDFKIGRFAVTKSFTLISCKDGTEKNIPSEDFSNENNNIESIQNILSLARSKDNNLTHYFVVDYNALKYNRISCLFIMPEPAPQNAPGYATPPLQKPFGQYPPGAYSAPPPQGAYGAPPPPPQATAPLEELSQQQLAQLKPKYSNLSDLQLQQGWQQYKSKDPNISSQDFVYRMLQPST